MQTKPTPSAKAAELQEFGAQPEYRPMMHELYRRAEAQLRKRRKHQRSEAGVSKSEADTQRLLHELQVHQVELEMQNEELQKTRDEMEAGLEKYSDLYDFSPVGYFTLAANSEIQLVNLTGARLVGIERSRLLGRPLALNVAVDLQPDFQAFLKRVFAGETKQSCEVTLLSAGQPPRAVNIEAQRSPNGRECRAVVVDITERQRASEAITKLAAIVQNTDDAIFTKTLAGVITSWNPGAERMFGYLAREIVGKSISVLIPPAYAGESERMFEKLRRGERVANFETERMGKDRLRVCVSLSIAPLRDGTGQWTSASVIARDITESKQAEATQRRGEVLAASNRKLEQEMVRRQAVEESLKKSEQHQSRLLEQSRQMQEQLRHLSRQVLQAQEEERKRISRELHDVIAQTLTSINLRLANLKKEAALNTKGLDRNIARTQRLVEKSVDIVHQFARELRPAMLDDLGLIPALHSFLKSFITRTGIRTRLTAFAAVEQLDGAKRTVLYRVAQEALTNVARHAQASQVEVRIQKLDGAVCMRIKDNGKGFQVERVSHAKKGERLGLLGMRERLEMVGGNFTVTSALGKGTTVLAQFLSAKGRTGEGGKLVAAARGSRTT